MRGTQSSMSLTIILRLMPRQTIYELLLAQGKIKPVKKYKPRVLTSKITVRSVGPKVVEIPVRVIKTLPRVKVKLSKPRKKYKLMYSSNNRAILNRLLRHSLFMSFYGF